MIGLSKSNSPRGDRLRRNNVTRKNSRNGGAGNDLLGCFRARPILSTSAIALVCLLLIHLALGGELSYNDQTLTLLESVSRSFVETPQTTTSSSILSLRTRSEQRVPSSLPHQSVLTIKEIQPVACTEQLANRKTDPADPNREEEESPKKFVNMTDPNFWISLHKASFDGMRWAHIMQKGNYYETGITEQFRSILFSSDKNGLVIDVGMNIGWFAIYSRAMGHNVVAFDPNPIMHTRVCESLHLNGWLDESASSSSSSVQTFAYGLGEEPATLNMTIGKNPGKASFFADRMAKWSRRTIEVPVVKLDDVAEQQDWFSTTQGPIYLLKLDVEGYEYYVLGGAKKLLHSGRIENILMENSNQDLRQVVDMYSTMYHAGYEIKMISSVNGNEFHPEMVARLNSDFRESSVGMDLNGIGKDGIGFLAGISCNLWWQKR